MLSLEQKAKELFEEYSLAQTGKQANWGYLNAKRQLVWMRDIYFIASKLIEDLRLNIKPFDFSPSQTSWGNGYNEGIKTERIRLLSSLADFEADLEQQVEEFKIRNEIQ